MIIHLKNRTTWYSWTCFQYHCIAADDSSLSIRFERTIEPWRATITNQYCTKKRYDLWPSIWSVAIYSVIKCSKKMPSHPFDTRSGSLFQCLVLVYWKFYFFKSNNKCTLDFFWMGEISWAKTKITYMQISSYINSKIFYTNTHNMIVLLFYFIKLLISYKRYPNI